MSTTASEFIKVLQGWIGMSRAKGTHKPIIDLYNSQKKLPRGYKVTYKDAYCATTLSAAAIKCNATDICPIECSCGELIEIAKEMGIWIENEKVTPEFGWWVLYDWDDDKDTYSTTDNKGYPEHVGAVEEVIGNEAIIIEGNYGGDVKRRTIQINGRFIRGYIVPKYDSEMKKETTDWREKIGEEVLFTGKTHYTSAGAKVGKSCKKGKAIVTDVAPGAAHPFHLVRVEGGTSTVWGWVDKEDVVFKGVGIVGPIDPCGPIYYRKYTGTSSKIDEVFKAIGVPSKYIKDKQGETYAVRTPIAKVNGISNYAGTAEQNKKLINLAKQGKLRALFS